MLFQTSPIGASEASRRLCLLVRGLLHLLNLSLNTGKAVLFHQGQGGLLYALRFRKPNISRVGRSARFLKFHLGDSI